MKYALVCLAVGLLRLSRLAWAQINPNDPDHGVRWVYPPRSESLTFHYLDTVQVVWTSYFDEPLLYTFCLSGSDNVIQKTLDQVEPFNGSHAIQLAWTDDGSPCWFNLRPNTSAGYGSNSVQWNYELSQRSLTTLGPELLSTTASESSSTTPSSTTSLVATGPATVLTPAGTDAPSSSPAASTGLGTGAQAGIGIGIGLGGLGLGAVGAVWFMRRRKTATAVSDSDSTPASAPYYHGYDHPQGGPGYGPSPAAYHDPAKASPEMAYTHAPQEMADTPIPQELGAEHRPVELPATFDRRDLGPAMTGLVMPFLSMFADN
ncbi:hypothetical protein DL764_000457 [Monosporascus ibericus]|uniref:Mid2 domain-containing protein n=1 Tax=Monosporascus ibericus TaxID=155417 RepID=A0A4Q4TTJ7_9PEZI|nr:hypothetical protein DL764_000457 [Monosporascus ibericus]